MIGVMLSRPVLYVGLNLTLFAASNSATTSGSAWPYQASIVSSTGAAKAIRLTNGAARRPPHSTLAPFRMSRRVRRLAEVSLVARTASPFRALGAEERREGEGWGGQGRYGE